MSACIVIKAVVFNQGSTRNYTNPLHRLELLHRSSMSNLKYFLRVLPQQKGLKNTILEVYGFPQLKLLVFVIINLNQ